MTIAPEKVWPRLKEHDPSGGTRLRTLKLTLTHGESLLPATSLVAVNADGSALDVGETLTITDVTYGLISASPSGDVWGVNFRVHLGVKTNVDYLLVLTPWVASQTGAPLYDRTFALPVEET